MEVKGIAERIEALVYQGEAGADESVELFVATCSYCYRLVGCGLTEEAETVCKWAEEMAAQSWKDEPMTEGVTKGFWGY